MKRFIFFGILLVPLMAVGQGFTFLDPTFKCAAPSGGATPSPAITAQSLGTLRNDYSGNVGFVFTNGAASVTVTSLGRWVVSGNNQTHTVKLFMWCGNGSGGNCGNLGPELSDYAILASATVNCADFLSGAYAFNSIAPVTLNANTKYAIVTTESNGGDFWYSNDTTVTLAADFSITGGTYEDGSRYNFLGDGVSYVPPNFKYTK